MEEDDECCTMVDGYGRGHTGSEIPGERTTASADGAATSPYFMAARFDADRTNANRFRTGDGIPIHIEMPLDRPWVPLQILAAAKAGDMKRDLVTQAAVTPQARQNDPVAQPTTQRDDPADALSYRSESP
jgi:hypothetical protein